MFYISEELHSKISEFGCELADSICTDAFTTLSLPIINEENDANDENTNTELYQIHFDKIYDFIANASYEVYNGKFTGFTSNSPLPQPLKQSDRYRLHKELTQKLGFFLPNLAVERTDWDEYTLDIWKSIPTISVDKWLDVQRNERKFIGAYGRKAMSFLRNKMNMLSEEEWIQPMLDLSTAHMPESEPDWWNFKFAQVDSGYVVWVSEAEIEDNNCPPWLEEIMLYALERGCVLIQFHSDAPVAAMFETYEWE
jgi:hypothetical protein